MMKGIRNLTIVLAVGAAAASASAVSVSAGRLAFGSSTATANFESYSQSGQFYSEAGLDFSINTSSSFSWTSYPGYDGSGNLYLNGGGSTMLSIVRSDAADFDQVALEIGTGFGISTAYVWARAFNNGSPVQDFDIDVPTGTGGNMTVYGGGWDELRIAAYSDPSARAAHSETQFQAIAVDKVEYGTSIPAPGALALLGLGGLAAARRRR